MPEAGWNGWYSDWWNNGNGGDPAWETFHTQELRRLLERDWGAGPRRVVAGLSMGGQGALMYAVEYVKQRAAFGKTIADMQGIQWKIAELATEIEAARLLTYRAAEMADAGKFTREYVPFLSMAKYKASEVAVKVAGEALQMLGAAGYMKDHLTELYYRDARQLTIVEGTSQVQRMVIARNFLFRS